MVIQPLARMAGHFQRSGKVCEGNWFDQLPGRQGGFPLHFGMPNTLGNRQTLGYRFQESILPLEQNVYILAVASDLSGALTLQHPRKQGNDLWSA
jgi:hypothetical protein